MGGSRRGHPRLRVPDLCDPLVRVDGRSRIRAGPPLSTAIITGARGQDGTYLTELLAARGLEVHGVDRGDIDLCDLDSVAGLLRETGATEVYHLAASTVVAQSWAQPVAHAHDAVLAITALLEAARTVGGVRLFYASSAEVFGEATESPQTESTQFRPVSPYGAGKAYGTFLVAAYRRRYGLHASTGILYNHESPRRPSTFLPSKVAHGVAAIAKGAESELVLGDLDAARDWGYAPDYVDAMWRVVHHAQPGDYVIATGELHTVRELVEIAFGHVGLDWQAHVRADPSLQDGRRELHGLTGDASRIRRELGWQPTVTFDGLVRLLVDAALEAS